MANRDDDMLPERENPFEALGGDAMTYEDEQMDTEPSRAAQYDDDEDEYELDEDEFDGDEESYRPSGRRGFFSTVQGKVLCVAIALLVAILIGVVVWRFAFWKPEGGASLPSSGDSQQSGSLVFTPESTDAPENDGYADDEAYGFDGEAADADGYDENGDLSSGGTANESASAANTPLVFGPGGEQTPEPETTPETTLPIIMTNTPTPSPTVAPSPTPSPTPEPSPSPSPSPTPRADLGTGKTNRNANLRETMSAKGKVLKTVGKGKSVTIHATVRDTSGNLWYAVTVTDGETEGWMRDYVVTLDGRLATTPTPEPGEAAALLDPSATPLPEGVIGSGKTKKDANIRKIMNGAVVVQLRKGRTVLILGVRQDKKGDTWYEVRTENGKKGFVRDYLIQLDPGVTLPDASASPAATETPKPDGAEDEADASDSDADEGGEERADATPKPTAEPKPTPTPNPLLEREVIGEAKTNREANVRERPAPNGKLVRQLSKGVELRILEKYDTDGNIWFEVVTPTGKTHGFVRDYVLSISEIDNELPAKTWGEAEGE